MSPAARLAPLQGSPAERRRRYAIARDKGTSPQDAAREAGVQPSTGKSYERWYQAQREEAPCDNWAAPAYAETERADRVLAQAYAFTEGDEELIGPLPEHVTARQREHSLACTASAAARSMPGIRAAVAFVGGRQAARFGADIGDRRLLLEACGLVPYEAVRLPVKGCEGRAKNARTPSGSGRGKLPGPEGTTTRGSAA